MLFGPVDPDPAAEQAGWGEDWTQEQFQTGQTTEPQANAYPAAPAESGADSALGPDEVDRGQ
jgi:hypothetical protein